MIEIKAPNEFPKDRLFTVFLAGSIEMGAAEKWQDTVASALKDCPVILLNPRRDDWDSSWKQTKDDPQFREQVEWELAGMEYADMVVFYFHPSTKSPITLLEFGLNANGYGNLLVCCPEGFYRKGNVDIVCEHYTIEQVSTLDKLIEAIREEATIFFDNNHREYDILI